MSQPEVKWFARGGGIAKYGPFSSQAEASMAMIQITESDDDYLRTVLAGSSRRQLNGGFADDVFVWPEY